MKCIFGIASSSFYEFLLNRAVDVALALDNKRGVTDIGVNALLGGCGRLERFEVSRMF